MVQRFRALVALIEDLSFLPSTPPHLVSVAWGTHSVHIYPWKHNTHTHRKNK